MSETGLRCRGCGHSQLEPILSLGESPLANAFILPEQLEQPEERYPLELVFCPECTLVQITEVVSPEKLFREYLYFSSFSDTMLRHAEELVVQQIEARSLNGNQLVIEIASNDGYLLQFYRDRGISVLGIEPSRNIAAFASETRKIPTVCEFFCEELARKLSDSGQQGDVIHANNVLAHVADINDFAKGLRLLLKENGVAVVEVPYIKDLVDRIEFDTIYHEHLYYFSLTALVNLFRRHGLAVIQAERTDIHGGSLRVTIGRHTELQVTDRHSDSVGALLREEAQWGVGDARFYQTFSEKVEHLRVSLLTLLRQLRAQNRRIVAYGASAKGTTLLNYFGIGTEYLDFVVDRSTVKQGRYTPGTRLPIFSPAKLLEEMPDYVLLLTWNFADEILEQQMPFRQKGGRFIIPLPEVRIV